MTRSESTPVQQFANSAADAHGSDNLADLLTAQEAARFLRVTVSWVYNTSDLRPRIASPS